MQKNVIQVNAISLKTYTYMSMNDLYQLEKGGVSATYEPYQVTLYPKEKVLFGNLDIPVKD